MPNITTNHAITYTNCNWFLTLNKLIQPYFVKPHVCCDSICCEKTLLWLSLLLLLILSEKGIIGAVSRNSAKLGITKCLLNEEKHENNRLKL